MDPFEKRIEQAKKSLVNTDFPTQVVVESTSICNFDCHGCPSPILQRERGFISLDLFKKIVDEIAKENPQSQLWFAFMGEALLWKDLFTLIRYAKDKGLQDTRLNTNGSLISKEKIRQIHESGLDKIIISIDGHSRETFDAIRPWKGGNYEKVKENTMRLLQTAREEKWKHPEIWVQMVVQDINAHEEEEFKNFWLSQGAVVKIRPRLSWGERVEAAWIEKLNISRDFPCPWLMRQVIVCYDGTIVMCGADHEAQYPVGNVKNMSLKEAWNGELKRRREQHLKNDFSFPLCVTCPDWKVGISEIYRLNEKTQREVEL